MSGRVLVTGGASGLGRALAERYAKAGWRVLVTDVDQTGGAETAKALSVHGEVAFLPLDVRDGTAWAAARTWCEQEWGGLDVLVNNAGVAVAGRMERIAVADWDWILDINLMGVVHGCRTFVPLFKAQSSGHLVNIASMAGLLNPPGMAPYNVAKAGVVSLSETLRAELEPYGIHTTVVCPSFFRTGLALSLRTPDPVFGKAMTKLVTGSPIPAEQIAEKIFQGAQRSRFLVSTHPKATLAWILKRHLPALAHRQAVGLARRLRTTTDADGADAGRAAADVTAERTAP